MPRPCLATTLILCAPLCACTKDDPDGRPLPEAPWPEWTFSPWVWEDESTQASATALVDGYLDHDIPVGAIIIDSPWETGYNTLEWDTALFPDPQGFIDEMHAKDVRVFLWIVPAINVDDPVEAALWQEGADAGYFMQEDADSGPAVFSWWKGNGSLVDYFNPDAVAWWHGRVDAALSMGIDGWKCDGLDFQALLTSYSPGAGREVERIEYSHAYYRDFFEYTREALGDDRIITARPVDNYGADLGGEVVSFQPVDIGWAGWVGDQDSDFSGLEAALNNMYWSAELGYVAFGSDIGGYRDDGDIANGRTKESFVRWAELGAFCPIMENGGGGEHRPWMFDEETADIYRAFAEIHMAMLPYLTREGAIAFEEGRSLLTFLSKEDYSYLLGPDVFVAPMLEEGTTRTLTLPPDGAWVYLFDASIAARGGTELTLDVPLDEFPVFVRLGADVFPE